MMTNMKIMFSVLLAALVLGGPALGQDLDGTLKKIKNVGDIYHRLPRGRPALLFPRAGQAAGGLLH